MNEIENFLRLAGIVENLRETEMSISQMREILKKGDPDDLDARLRFATAQDAVNALDRLAPIAHEAILKALGSVLDNDPTIDPEIEIADLLEVVFSKYGTNPDTFVEQ